ncbi:CG0192-related protein [Herbiconiux sp. YIM B11900]|uniref:CG0192-related protein n=1 Tax=Herbiconiux sp. YIM B11900 TaxID=3404131 RepID=UPI003F82B3AA
MALIHQATIVPSKLELAAAWAPHRPWFAGRVSPPLAVGSAFRFDDPAGEVGIETLLLQDADGSTVQVPLSYRGAELAGAEGSLVGTMEHSVLGSRWVYDAAGDPVAVAALVSAILERGREAELEVETAEGRVRREADASVLGSGVDAGGAGGSGRSAPLRAPSPAELGLPVVHDVEGATVVEAGPVRLVLPRIPGATADELRALLSTPPGGTDAGEVDIESAGVVTGVLTGTWTGQPEPRILALLELRR